MGGSKPWPEVPLTNKDTTSAAVCIVGAGISGICTAIELLRTNKCQNFVILEKSASVGGTWHDNKYPGCCCDVWSLLYSFSFEQNPNWTREYPGQEEILAYLIQVAEKYNLYRYIRFNSHVQSATWNDAEKRWKVHVKVSEGSKESEFEGEYTMTSDFLVSAVGQLNVPKMPNIDGLDDFQGKKMHSARWDWKYDIKGKRVALIGNGATAAQIAPEVAQEAAHLTIYQRTPNWVIPRLDHEVSDFRKLVQKYFPPYMWRIRAGMMDFREAFFDAVWDPESPIAQMLKDQCFDMMKAALPGQEDLWKKLTPDYPVGCKRVVISDDYYPTIARDNVTLETRGIQRITDRGVVVKGENDVGAESETEESFDLIAFATGFKTTDFLHPVKVTGRNGRSLSKIWEEGALAYHGITVPDLPNFAMLYGPNTNLGHNSIVLMIEAQSKYISALVAAVLEARTRDPEGSTQDAKLTPGGGMPIALVPKAEKVQEYNKNMQDLLNKSSFADSRASSWYKLSNGKITNNWSSTVVDYQKMTSGVDWDDYEDGDKVKEMRNGEQKVSWPRVVEESLISDKWLAGLSAAAVIGAAVGWFGRNHRLFTRLTG